ncbi:hypothetical protein ACFSJ3_01255 [Corallincola platygyrae]|uniref:Collagen IV NC1 domain-containing protein n=1 Tax=Corallincola platygyrae TaxID=1193278 RepID=A0ABW4XIW5_9GAMM
MSSNRIAIVLSENEIEIKNLAAQMHVWIAGTKSNVKVVKALWKSSLPSQLTQTYFDISSDSSKEEQCIGAIDQVDAHHCTAFGTESWSEIQVHGTPLTQRLSNEFEMFGNVAIKRTDYGFTVHRQSQT